MYMNNLITNVLTLGSQNENTDISTLSNHTETRVTYTTTSGLADWIQEIEGTLSIPNRFDVENVDIGNTVTSIGNLGIADSQLTNIMIPDNVASIEDFAFIRCKRLEEFTIGIGITSIRSNSFAWCISLRNIILPDSITNIGSNAFNGCNDIASVTIYANNGNADNVKQMMIDAGVPSTGVTWNMPS